MMDNTQDVELIGLIQISEIIDSDINSAFNIYAKFFGTLVGGSDKITALNMFTEKLKKYINSNDLTILSNYASIYALEPAFKEEYAKVSNRIDEILKTR
jgi:hypothetical protein